MAVAPPPNPPPLQQPMDNPILVRGSGNSPTRRRRLQTTTCQGPRRPEQEPAPLTARVIRSRMSAKDARMHWGPPDGVDADGDPAHVVVGARGARRVRSSRALTHHGWSRPMGYGAKQAALRASAQTCAARRA